MGGNGCPGDYQEGGFRGTCPTTDEDVLACEHPVFEAVSEGAVESTCPNQILHLEVASVELADRERHAAETARRDHRCYSAAIGQPRVKNGLRFGDVVAETASDILHGDHKRFLSDGDARHVLKEALVFDEHAVGTIHHHLADRIIENEVLDRLEKRQGPLETVRHRAPSASCLKKDCFAWL